MPLGSAGGNPLALRFPARLPLLLSVASSLPAAVLRPAMEYEDESTNDNSQDYSQMLCENSQDDEKYEIPDSIEDEDYTGLELDLMVFCRKHGKATERFVAFEGTSTNTSFLACAEQAQETRTKEHLYVVNEYKKEFEGQKAEIARKEGENQKLNEKNVILQNLLRAQGKMIKNLKCNHLKKRRG
ncbi:hypothetical protein ZWY2020_004045 [Hordeum vulgare]|nr:hypothetical protein ZWY2020_004045 [Hordeum vulgare]